MIYKAIEELNKYTGWTYFNNCYDNQLIACGQTSTGKNIKLVLKKYTSTDVAMLEIYCK